MPLATVSRMRWDSSRSCRSMGDWKRSEMRTAARMKTTRKMTAAIRASVDVTCPRLMI